MLKKLFVLSIFFFSAAFASHPAEAASMSCPDLAGKYRIEGNLKISVNFPDYISATITLPKLSSLSNNATGEYFYFYGDGVFTDTLMDEYLDAGLGRWVQNGCSFTIDFLPLAQSFVAMLEDDYDMKGVVVGSTILTGKISTRDGTNSGRFTLKFDVSSPIQGTLSISLSFKGIPVASDSMSQGEPSTLNPQIKNFISGIFSSLPRKEASIDK